MPVSDPSSNSSSHDHGHDNSDHDHDHSDNDDNNSNDDHSNITSVDLSYNSTYDLSYTVFTTLSTTILPDLSCNDALPIMTDISSSIIIDGSGYEIVYSTGTDSSGAFLTQTTFNTTDPSQNDPIIKGILTETVTKYDDVTGVTDILLNEIRGYANEIQCPDFHGKGSIDDYAVLFQAASRIASESKQMELNVDVEGFTEFGDAADQLSELFHGFIVRLQNVNIITDTTFLTSIAAALKKIVNLSNIFGRFKETIIATSTIQIPKSAHDATVLIQGVMDEVNCAMQYINYFVDPSSNPTLHDAALDATEKKIIKQAVNTINNWTELCDSGVSIAMSNDADIKFITKSSKELKQTTTTLKNVTATLRTKLAGFQIGC